MGLVTLAFWIAAALLSYAVARNKGRDPIVAIAMSLIFGFLALIYYLLARGSKEYEVRRAKEIVRRSKRDGVETREEGEEKNSPNDTLKVHWGSIIILTIVAFLLIFVIGAIASAFSDKSTSNTPNLQFKPNYQEQIVTQPIKSNRYPEITRTTSVESCLKFGGNQRYCECALEYWEANYTLNEYAGMQEELKNKKIPSGVYEAATACQSYK